MARKTLPEPSESVAEVPASVTENKALRERIADLENQLAELTDIYVRWPEDNEARLVFFRDYNMQPVCRIKVDKDIEFQSPTQRETQRLCQERLDRRKMRARS